MKYIKVKWLHSLPDMPVLLYSELDPDMWEVRKVEAYADGTTDFADCDESSGSTELGIEPCPLLEVIAADPEFEPEVISREEFEAVWQHAKGTARARGVRNDRTNLSIGSTADDDG
ncbi:DUF6881 domain-containing protein [Rhizobium ecuadorense]|uniref:DUF6881 domain-containing protein n=1 Tax=Rhizobium ecuadorense TaxID=1671795 RepID=UPI0007C87441|nr:hypothetical protein [Rhizobium ecuadorense]